MTTTYPFQEISVWLSAPADRQRPLGGDTDADVVIVGGGYTGLATALALKKQGVGDVVVLDQAFAGSGASGRNAGHVTPTIGKDLPTLLRMFGRERAAKLVRFADEAVDYASALIEERQIECEYVNHGNIMAGVHPKQEKKLKEAAELGRSLGGDVAFLTEGDMRERGLPPAFLCGVHERRGGVLQPGMLALGLRRAALQAGVRLYENTPVKRLEDGVRPRVHCDGAIVVADSAVVATNAYTAGIGYNKRAVAPVRVSLLETAPLDDAQLEALDWRGREGIYTAHEALESFRLTAKNTIVAGSKKVSFKFGDGLPDAYDTKAFEAITWALRERFPEVADLEIHDYWGGWIGFTPDFLPTIGTTGNHRNVHHGYGYAGHGVPQACFMGDLLSERVLGRKHAAEHAIERRVWNWPPEPFRFMAASLLDFVLRLMDNRTDRQIQRLAASRPQLTSGAKAPSRVRRKRT